MLLCHLRHLERCHPRLWIKQQPLLLPDLWCGAVPDGLADYNNCASGDGSNEIVDGPFAAAVDGILDSPAGSSSTVCWQWLAKCAEAQVIVYLHFGIQQLWEIVRFISVSGRLPGGSAMCELCSNESLL
jgi:hypothetical protein